MVCIAAVAVVPGCGYTTRSLIADKYSTIYITPFKNKIDISGETITHNYRLYRPLLETDITSAVVQKFLIDGNLKPVRQRENADLVLEGELTDFSKDAVAYNSHDNVREYRVNITVKIKLTDIEAGQALWELPSFTGSATYFLAGSNASSEAAAITEAIKDLSRRIVEQTVDQW